MTFYAAGLMFSCCVFAGVTRGTNSTDVLYIHVDGYKQGIVLHGMISVRLAQLRPNNIVAEPISS